MNISLGKIAFEAYREVRHGEAYDGTFIPEWKDIRDGVKDAWEVAALAVKDEVLDQVQEAGMNFSQ